jgi:hypothetical protein
MTEPVADQGNCADPVFLRERRNRAPRSAARHPRDVLFGRGQMGLHPDDEGITSENGSSDRAACDALLTLLHRKHPRRSKIVREGGAVW